MQQAETTGAEPVFVAPAQNFRSFLLSTWAIMVAARLILGRESKNSLALFVKINHLILGRESEQKKIFFLGGGL